MATLKDVAQLAGVGLATASRAISGSGPVSEDAQRRVQAAIEQLKFRPSSLGRSLSKQSLGMIGIFAPSYFGAYYGTILNQTDHELRAVGKHVVITTGIGDGTPREKAIEGVKYLIGRDCDGILVLGHDLHEDDMARLQRLHPHLAYLNRVNPHAPDASFCPDHVHGGRLAARVLLDAGHRRLAVISGPSGARDNTDRLQGFFDALATAGIARDDVVMVESDFSREGGFAATGELLAKGDTFTGLFCANDEMAVGALSRLHRAGVRVPEQISIVGYDDDYSAAFTAPELTTIHIPIKEMAQSAARWLLNQCYGTALGICREFPVEVMERDSVARLAPADAR